MRNALLHKRSSGVDTISLCTCNAGMLGWHFTFGTGVSRQYLPCTSAWLPWDRFNIKSCQYRIPILRIRRSHDHLIFNMGIPVPGKTVFIWRRGPGLFTYLFWWLALSVQLALSSRHCGMYSYVVTLNHFYSLRFDDIISDGSVSFRAHLALIIRNTYLKSNIVCL